MTKNNKNKNGFVSTTVMVTFFITFLLIMSLTINKYISNRRVLNIYKMDIKRSLMGETTCNP